MFIATLAAAAPAAAKGENPYGLIPAIVEGGPLTWATAAILVFMSVGTFYILFTKIYDQQKIFAQTKKVRQGFWSNPSLKEAAAKLDKDSAYKQIVDDGMLALDQHAKLTDPVEAHDWLHGSLNRSQAAINSKLGEGLAFLATVGSTAPFIGLFGTVVGILNALIKIGAAGQASIDAVAGPVGEALIMTAIGLVVAVPAVLAFNWLQRRNKAISEDLGAFSNDLLGYMMSGGSVKPVVGGRPAPAKAAAPVAPAKPAAAGGVSTTKA